MPNEKDIEWATDPDTNQSVMLIRVADEQWGIAVGQHPIPEDAPLLCFWLWSSLLELLEIEHVSFRGIVALEILRRKISNQLPGVLAVSLT